MSSRPQESWNAFHWTNGWWRSQDMEGEIGGEVDGVDWSENESALRQGSRLFSEYRSKAGVIFLIITEADRSTTTILLPGEY